VVWRFVIPENIVEQVKSAFGILEDSGISGEGLTFDTEMYPYYDCLSEEGKQLYAQVYANALAEKTTFVPIVDITTTEVENVVKLVYYDHPELFWMDSGYSYKYVENNICVQITLRFNETAENLSESRKVFEEKAFYIMEEASKLSSDYEKEQYVYMALINMTEYDKQASIHQSPYSALVNGKSVCAGYARAFQYIMIELGIPTYYCAGMTEGHAWNIVKLEDGYYNVDLTMANKHAREGAFLNRTDKEVSGTHKRSGYSTLLPKCTAVKYKSDSQ
jgi:hypothetical protein